MIVMEPIGYDSNLWIVRVFVVHELQLIKYS